MIEAHEKHTERSASCPLCDRFGSGPSDKVYKGRLFAVNPPYSTEPTNW